MIGVSMFYNVLQEKPISRNVNSQARSVEPFVYARKILPFRNIRFMNSRPSVLLPPGRSPRGWDSGHGARTPRAGTPPTPILNGPWFLIHSAVLSPEASNWPVRYPTHYSGRAAFLGGAG